MSFPTNVGTTAQYGGQPTIAGAEVIKWETGGSQVKEELYENAAGQDIGVLIHQIKDRIRVELLCLTLTAGGVATLFPEHLMCTLTGYTNYRVKSVSIPQDKGPLRVTAEMVREFGTA